MQESHTYDLLSKYMNHTITPNQLSELRALVNISDDEELFLSLSLLWNKYEEVGTSHEPVVKEMLTHIRKQTPQVYVAAMFRRIIRVAAVLFMLFLSSLSMYLYNNLANSDLANGNLTVEVNRGEKAAVTLPDGTKVRLNAESCLSYATDFDKSIRKVDLKGEAFFEVTKDEERPFVVTTGYVNIEVLGTSFNVYSFEQENVIEMTLVSGRIKLTSLADPTNATYLNPNEKALFNKQSGEFVVRKTDNRFETAWLRGNLAFHSARMSDIILKLERRYGVNIHLGNSSIANDLFTGSFDSEYIMDVMNILEKHYGFTYVIQGNDIYINP